jgi:hypothetical protein
MTRSNSKLLFAEIQKVIGGVQKHLAGQSLVLAGTTITSDDLVTELTGVATQIGTVESSRQSWLTNSRALDETISTTYEPRITALHRLVESRFGLGGAELVDFGMKPRSPRKRTGQEIVATAQKSAATRTARHTVGPRQKQAIHGTVTASESTPTTAATSAPTAPGTPTPDTKRNS